MKIVVIIPTYNERENIIKMLPLLENEIFPTIKSHSMHILVVDDTSPDHTADEVAKYMKLHKNISLLSGAKQGLGAAYARGMKYAMVHMHADAVIEFDADFQHDPYDIPRLIHAMDNGSDYVIGSRYIAGGKIPKEWGFNRKFLSYVGGSFVGRVMLGIWHIHDITSGFKLTKTVFLKNVDLDHLYSKDFAYKMHILHDVVKQGAHVVEIPIEFYERKEGISKISQRTQFDSLWLVTRLRWDDSQRFIKFLIVGGTGFVVQLVAQEGSVHVGATHTVGVGVGAEAAIISNFLFNNYWTFQDVNSHGQASNFLTRLVKFNVTSLGAILLQVLAIALFERFFGVTMHIAGHAVATRIIMLFPTIILLVIPLNYLIYNKIIWKTHKVKEN